MENMHNCRRCGYALEVGTLEYCLPCTLRMAISAMSGVLVPPLSQVARRTVASVGNRAAPKAVLPAKKTKVQKPTGKKKSAKRSNEKVRHVGPGTFTAPQRPTREPPGGSYSCCILCGQRIRSGELLAHKIAVHGEAPTKPQKRRTSPNTWVSIVQGGLPGLGKKR